MPLDIPGYYFDASKNRYFKIGSKSHNNVTPASQKPAIVQPHPKTRNLTNIIKKNQLQTSFFNDAVLSMFPRLQNRLVYDLEPIERGNEIISDLKVSEQSNCVLIAKESHYDVFNPEIGCALHVAVDNISSINFCAPSSPNTFKVISTSFDGIIDVYQINDFRWRERIFAASTNNTIFFCSATPVADPNTIAVGANNKVYIIRNLSEWTEIPVVSDVLAQTFDTNKNCLIFNGLRSGAVLLHDTRKLSKRKRNEDCLFKQSSCITSLTALNSHEILASSIDGIINIWDTRYHSSPVLSINGCGTTNQKVKPRVYRDFVTVGGDKCVKVYDLRQQGKLVWERSSDLGFVSVVEMTDSKDGAFDMYISNGRKLELLS